MVSHLMSTTDDDWTARAGNEAITLSSPSYALQELQNHTHHATDYFVNQTVNQYLPSCWPPCCLQRTEQSTEADGVFWMGGLNPDGQPARAKKNCSPIFFPPHAPTEFFVLFLNFRMFACRLCSIFSIRARVFWPMFRPAPHASCFAPQASAF